MRLILFFQIVLQGADWLTTAIGWEMGLRETNPIMREVLVEYGVLGHGVIKATGAIAIIFLVWLVRRTPWIPWVVVALNGIMLGIVANNYCLILAP